MKKYQKILTVAICTIASLFISSNSYADDVEGNWMINTGFKDYNLFDCVLDEYMYINDVSFEDIYEEIGPNGALPESGLQNINYLSCRNYGITDATGLDKLPNIEYLNLRRNYLTTIDLSQNAELINLDLDSNLLTSIDLSANKKIQSLTIFNNRLTQANLYYNTNLVSLSISGNSLSELDLSNSPLLSAIDIDNIKLTTSARAKKNGDSYTFHFPMPFFANSFAGSSDSPVQVLNPGDAPLLNATYQSEPTRSLMPFARWEPSTSPNYSYDTDLGDFVTETRAALTDGFGIEYSYSGGGDVELLAADRNAEPAPDTLSADLDSRPVSILPSFVVDGANYSISDTSLLPTKYIGEAWDSNDYREIIDQALVNNNLENVKLVKVEIYNSLKDTPNTEVGLNPQSTSLHLFGTIPDIEVPMRNVIIESFDPDDDSTDSNASSREEISYNPETILAPGTPDFKIVYYLETVDPSIAVPDTGFSSRWTGSETISVTPLFVIVSSIALVTGSIIHIINCQRQKQKVNFKKH